MGSPSYFKLSVNHTAKYCFMFLTGAGWAAVVGDASSKT